MFIAFQARNSFIFRYHSVKLFEVLYITKKLTGFKAFIYKYSKNFIEIVYQNHLRRKNHNWIKNPDFQT